MNILPISEIDNTIKNVFPWLNKKPQGYSVQEIKDLEKRLGFALPTALTSIYKANRLEEILSSQNIILVDFDKLISHENKLTFGLSYTNEIEGVKYWAIDIKNDSKVFSRLTNSEQWIEEYIDLNSFINLYLYRQAIKKEYKHCGTIGLSGDDLFYELEADWEKIVDYNGLHVYWQENALIWTIEFSEDEDIENDIFFSTYAEEIYYLNEVRYKLSQI